MVPYSHNMIGLVGHKGDHQYHGFLLHPVTGKLFAETGSSIQWTWWEKLKKTGKTEIRIDNNYQLNKNHYILLYGYKSRDKRKLLWNCFVTSRSKHHTNELQKRSFNYMEALQNDTNEPVIHHWSEFGVQISRSLGILICPTTTWTEFMWNFSKEDCDKFSKLNFYSTFNCNSIVFVFVSIWYQSIIVLKN